MSEPRIPVALDPEDNPVPIEEAERFTPNYYRCPECGKFVNPRKGEKRVHYYAHAPGVLEEITCPLGTQADVERLIDEYRTSEVEKDERERSIRVAIRPTYGGNVELFGIVPTIEWEEIDPQTSVETELKSISVSGEGIERLPVATNFHPSEPEVTFELDPTAEAYELDVKGPEQFETVRGTWTADSIEVEDVFIGDETRAIRRKKTRRIKEGDWVYVTMDEEPPSLPDEAEVSSSDSLLFLGFPIVDETQDLVSEYVGEAQTDEHGFDADVILPSGANPTTEAPIGANPGTPTLIGIEPSSDIDPIFEVVSVPKRKGDTIVIEPTGAENPRFYGSSFPDRGSRRISIHQRNSDRHRLVHLHSVADKSGERLQKTEPTPEIGVEVQLENGKTKFLNPIDEPRMTTLGPHIDAYSIETRLDVRAPDGFAFDVEAQFSDAADIGPVVTRTDITLEEVVPEFSHWIVEGCNTIRFSFDGLGTVGLRFQEPGKGA